jgi:hypothetical protein
MFQLQKQGLGAAKGIPSTVVIAASFDDIIAITGFSIFINVAIATGDNAAWLIASGPLQVCMCMCAGSLWVLGRGGVVTLVCACITNDRGQSLFLRCAVAHFRLVCSWLRHAAGVAFTR